MSTTDREIVITRLIEAPRDRVWAAVSILEEKERWWGPTGFTTRTESYAFEPGGTWRLTLIGPDGAEYPNLTRFEEVEPPERFAYKNGGGRKGGVGANFRATWTLRSVGDQTEVTLHTVFPTAEVREHVVKTYNAIEGGHQTLARLAEHCGG